MTDREKAIVMAYTGISMLVGDKFSIFHEYIEKICGRPIWTHELVDKTVCDEIKEKSKPDFIQLCRETTKPIRRGHWIDGDDGLTSGTCSYCNWEAHFYEDDVAGMAYCPNCGAKMDGKEQGK